MTDKDLQSLKAAANLLAERGEEISSAAKRLFDSATCPCGNFRDIDEMCDKCYLEHYDKAYFDICGLSNDGTR